MEEVPALLSAQETPGTSYKNDRVGLPGMRCGPVFVPAPFAALNLLAGGGRDLLENNAFFGSR
jgi:hypothetical protein